MRPQLSNLVLLFIFGGFLRLKADIRTRDLPIASVLTTQLRHTLLFYLRHTLLFYLRHTLLFYLRHTLLFYLRHAHKINDKFSSSLVVYVLKQNFHIFAKIPNRKIFPSSLTVRGLCCTVFVYPPPPPLLHIKKIQYIREALVMCCLQALNKCNNRIKEPITGTDTLLRIP